jgi:hypothetical protein
MEGWILMMKNVERKINRRGGRGMVLQETAFSASG